MRSPRTMPQLLIGLALVALILAGCGPDLAQLDSPHGLSITGIALMDAHSGYAVGLRPGVGHPVLLRENNDIWQPDAQPPDLKEGDNLRAVALAGTTLWVAGERSDATHGDATQETGFAFSRGADGVWQRMAFSSAINAITFLSPTEGWAVGNNGAIYHYLKGVWTQFPNSMDSNLYAVAFRSPTDGWATGEMGTFVHFDGTGWYHQVHFTHADIFGVALSPTDGWAVGTDGDIARLGSDGNWFDVATPIDVTGRAVTIVQGNVWLVGDSGLVFERTADDGGWNHIRPPDDARLNTIAISPTGDIWVGGNLNQSNLYSWQNGNWHTITTGLR